MGENESVSKLEIQSEEDSELNTLEGSETDEGETDEESPTTGVNWTTAGQRDKHGILDKAATLKLVEAELEAAVSSEPGLNEIAEVAAKVATRWLAAKLDKPLGIDGFSGRCVELLDPPMGAEIMLKKRVMEFLRGESKIFEQSRGTNGLYHVGRGKLGGVHPATDAYRKSFSEFLVRKEKKNTAK